MKKALLVGINYKGTGNDLRGCINDVYNMYEMLTNEFNDFRFDKIETLIETQATTQGILDALERLVDGAKPGDVLLFHYSGHGSQVLSDTEPDRMDEIICPIDLDWRTKVIKDDDLKRIFNKVPNGVNVTVVLDCCHSGTGLDQTESLFNKDYPASTVISNKTNALDRYLPPPADLSFIKLPVREWKTSRDVNRSALLIAGCASNQTAADAYIDGQFQGAATAALIRAVRRGEVRYRAIVEEMTNYMVLNGYSQRPQLDGHPSLYDQAFLEPWGYLFGTPTETPPPGTWVSPQEQQGIPGKKSNKGWIAAAIGIAIAILIAISTK